MPREYEQKTRAARDKLDARLLAVLGQLPQREANAKSQVQDLRNRFIQDNYSIPLFPVLREESLAFVQERLQLDVAYLKELADLRAKMPTMSIGEGDRRTLELMLKTAGDNVRKLESLQRQVADLPAKSDLVVGNVRLGGTLPTTPTTPTTPSTPTTPTTPSTPTEIPVSKDWKVQADPAKATPTFVEKLLYKELAGVSSRRVVFVPGQGAALLVGVAETPGAVDFDHLLIGDLRTGKPMGLIRNVGLRPETHKLAERPTLSADGKHVAYLDMRANAVKIFATAGGKLLHSLPWQGRGLALFFPTPEQLLAIPHDDEPSQARLWEVASGKPIREFSVQKLDDDNAGLVAVSPGGRFLAMAPKQGDFFPKTIYLYDLSTGKAAGKLQPEALMANSPPQIRALAFSPDGKELAACVNYPVRISSVEESVTCWNLATGQEIARLPIEKQNLGMIATPICSEPLQWFPDGKGWLLYQRYMVNRANGKLTQTIDALGDTNAQLGTKILDNTRVLVPDNQKLLVKEITRP